jgi:hypothetical protein
VAQAAGDAWPEVVHQASRTHRRPPDEDSIGTLLLRDLKTIMAREPARERYSMADLAPAQRALDVPEFHGTLNSRDLGRILRGYGIRAQTIRFGDSTAKGYYRTQFEDAFARYAEESREIG